MSDQSVPRRLQAPWLPSAVEQALIVVWLGSLWTVGYLVAPVLFATIPDRALAGLVAGRLFGLVAWIGLGCGVLSLGFALRGWRRGASFAVPLIIAGMLLLGVIGEFGLQAAMAALKADGASGSPAFARLHGIAASLYLVESVLGVLWLGLRARGLRPAA